MKTTKYTLYPNLICIAVFCMAKQLTGQFVVRVTEDLESLVRSVAIARGEDMSDFIRRAIKVELAKLSFLSPEEKKALGIN